MSILLYRQRSTTHM